jgi:hypothetical protein
MSVNQAFLANHTGLSSSTDEVPFTRSSGKKKKTHFGNVANIAGSIAPGWYFAHNLQHCNKGRILLVLDG